MKSILKSILPHILSILSFVIIASAYFHPAWEGKSLQGEDIVGSYGLNREKKDFQKYEDKTVLWNEAVFSGMPDLVFSRFKGASGLRKIYDWPRRMGMPREVASIMWYMIGFYILLVSLGIKPFISAGGAIAFSLSSYYIIIILAGHFMKVDTLALVPPTLAGILLCFNRKYLWGFLLTSFFLAFQINMAHIQMIYYFLISLGILGLVEFYFHLKEKKLKQFAISVAVLIGAAIMGIAPNSAKLLTYYKYNDYSIRGSSELTIGKEDVKTDKGLDKDYINAWSSGVDEAIMIIAPNVKGGSTGSIKQDRDLLKKVPRQYRETIGNFNQYWGNQPFSGGPNYLGIIFIFLFVLGAFLIPGRLKIAAIAPVILFFFLSMGGNFSAFTDLFIDYVPMYNKFRTPVSILALAAIWVGMWAIFTLYKVYSEPSLLEKRKKIFLFKKEQPVYLLVSAGFLLFLLINIALPELFNNYISNNEQNQFNSLRNQPNVGNQLDNIIAALVDFRIGIFRAELWRTFLFVAALTALLFAYAKGKLKATVVIATVLTLAVIDFWGTSRRYVSLDHFHKKGNAVKQAYQLTDTDHQIYRLEQAANPELPGKIEELKTRFKPTNAKEKERLITYATNKYNHYRIFNLARSPFNENITTNAHNSVGGYHAVKLRRYQDMIEHHIGKMNISVLNMLNTKYIINQNGLQRNPGAMGAAWFVDSVKWVDNPNDEILALNEIDVTRTAVLRTDNKDKTGETGSGTGEIKLTEYSPDYLVYTTKTNASKLAVFSEVYFPDWEVYIDGEQSTLFPANYILRGMMVPAGEHKIEFKFNPEYYYKSNNFAQIVYYLLLLIITGAIAYEIYRNRNKIKELKTS
ncbi:MAG: YfhO family protein [Bacteroidota bacterium]